MSSPSSAPVLNVRATLHQKLRFCCMTFFCFARALVAFICGFRIHKQSCVHASFLKDHGKRWNSGRGGRDPLPPPRSPVVIWDANNRVESLLSLFPPLARSSCGHYGTKTASSLGAWRLDLDPPPEPTGVPQTRRSSAVRPQLLFATSNEHNFIVR